MACQRIGHTCSARQASTLISDIREEKAQGLQQKIGEINKKYKLGYEKPSVDDIQGWINAANA